MLLLTLCYYHRFFVPTAYLALCSHLNVLTFFPLKVDAQNKEVLETAFIYTLNVCQCRLNINSNGCLNDDAFFEFLQTSISLPQLLCYKFLFAERLYSFFCGRLYHDMKCSVL